MFSTFVDLAGGRGYYNCDYTWKRKEEGSKNREFETEYLVFSHKHG